jgi:leader peptidase (prepilin peptidase)/N-methyltransferase
MWGEKGKMIIALGTMIYLGILAVMDARKRELPTWLLLAGSVAAILAAVWFLANEGVTWEGLMLGAVPGGIILALAGIGGGAGAGDGIVLLQVNLLLLLDKVVIAFALSLMLMGIFAAALLMLKKGAKDTRLPYVPFLWLGCLGAFCICGIT